ncbi:MAG: YvcK family protein [Actinomycetia bacterium]|nr:YvcK family protein [Actinomycetes bacterium]
MKRAVAIGGGTGLPVVLKCLAASDFDVTAIVTVADDGGSSGTLRRELGVLPPGDIRNCLVALAAPDSLLAEVFQYRFAAGEGLAGHSLGNLIIAALADMRGDFATAIKDASKLLGVCGTVLPSTLADVVLFAEDETGARVTGQANVAHSTSMVCSVHLEPASPPAYPPVLDAIRSADVVVLGPGSLYTSIMPNLLIKGVSEALCATHARIIYVCNVANQRGETSGLDAADHVRALEDHGLRGAIDVVLLHDTDVAPRATDVLAVESGAAQRSAIESRGITVVATELADRLNPMHHDAALLCAALRRLA